MATTNRKRGTKAPKASAPRSQKQRELENATSPEDIVAGLDAAREEHKREVQELGNSIIDVIEAADYHPTVALDAFHILLSAGIRKVFGPDHQQLWENYVRRYREESSLLSVLRAFETMGDKPQ